MADTIKFAFVFVVLVIVLWVLGHPPNGAYIALPVVLATELAFTCGVSFLLAALVPLVPDLRFVIMPILQGLFFLSAIFYSFDSVPRRCAIGSTINPIAVIIDSGREILLYGRMPDLERLGLLALAGLLVLSLGMALIHRMSPLYPKLAD